MPTIAWSSLLMWPTALVQPLPRYLARGRCGELRAPDAGGGVARRARRRGAKRQTADMTSAAPRLVAVAHLARLVDAGGGARGHHRTHGDATRGGQVHLHSGVAARVENLAADDGADLGEGVGVLLLDESEDAGVHHGCRERRLSGVEIRCRSPRRRCGDRPTFFFLCSSPRTKIALSNLHSHRSTFFSVVALTNIPESGLLTDRVCDEERLRRVSRRLLRGHRGPISWPSEAAAGHTAARVTPTIVLGMFFIHFGFLKIPRLSHQSRPHP